VQGRNLMAVVDPGASVSMIRPKKPLPRRSAFPAASYCNLYPGSLDDGLASQAPEHEADHGRSNKGSRFADVTFEVSARCRGERGEDDPKRLATLARVEA
jgi:hypothetical protein